MSAPSNRASPQPLAETSSTPSTSCDRVDRPSGLKPGAWALDGGDVQVGVGLVAEDVAERRLQRRGEDAHADDQGQADHQGRRRRQRYGAGCASRSAWPARRAARAAAAAPRSTAASGRDRERQRDHHADHRRRAGRARRPSCPRRRTAPTAGRRRRRRGRPAPTTARRFERLLRARGGLAQRLDRQHLGGPAGRDQRGDDGDDGADEQRDPGCVRGSICSEVLGRAEADRVHQGLQALGRRRCRARCRPPRRPDPSRSASSSRLPHHLAPAWHRSPAAARSRASAG